MRPPLNNKKDTRDKNLEVGARRNQNRWLSETKKVSRNPEEHRFKAQKGLCWGAVKVLG